MGSSLFLKLHYGEGYHLTMARSNSAAHSAPAAAMLRLLQRHVPEAQLLTDVGAEVSVQLPSSKSAAFAPMLRELQPNLPALGLAQFGASQASCHPSNHAICHTLMPTSKPAFTISGNAELTPAAGFVPLACRYETDEY